MRYPRQQQLYTEAGIVHKYWKCHNNDYMFQKKDTKNLYFDSIGRGLRKEITLGNVKLHAFALMGNHSHQLLQYTNGSKHLSNYMRSAHTRFGRIFNDLNNRSGKVGNDRPKTPLIEDSSHGMLVHFYIEANPVRANICTIENLKSYPYSSYGFYAYGITNRFTKLLDPPDWYIELGDSPMQRQKKYRKLFKEYMSEFTSKYHFSESFIGSDAWKKECNVSMKTKTKKAEVKPQPFSVP